MASKGSANAGQRRKPRGRTIDQNALKELKENIVDRELLRLAYRLEILEELRKARELNTPFIALEALGALAGGKKAGVSEEDLQSCWPKEWGDETITVPLSLVSALRDGWHDYKTAPSGKSLGEALKIEGGGQGRKPMKARLETIDRARKLARAVESRYLQIEGEPASMTLDDVVWEVANTHNVSFQMVKDAHNVHAKAIRRELEMLGVLKVVKTTRS
jgi:hypothetical protein